MLDKYGTFVFENYQQKEDKVERMIETYAFVLHALYQIDVK